MAASEFLTRTFIPRRTTSRAFTRDASPMDNAMMAKIDRKERAQRVLLLKDLLRGVQVAKGVLHRSDQT